MKLQEVYLLKSTKGITLFEVITTIAIFTLLIAFLSYREREFDVHSKSIVQSLRRAQLQSMVGEKESSFGLYFEANYYILFKGNSYSGRDSAFDEVFELPADFLVSGISEIVFSKIKGIPSDTGDIILSSGNRSETISINEMGMINY
jgi:hypothetical protein